MRKMKLPQGWYPKSAQEITISIKEYLNGFKPETILNPIAGIVPHAGWYFSGKLACRVMSILANSSPDTVILFGGHLANERPHIFTDEAFETPLGTLNSDEEIIQLLENDCSEEPVYETDNTVEIQLAFIKYFFPEAKIAAFRSPSHEKAVDLGKRCAEAVRNLERKAVFIGSLDLTHYGPRYGFTPQGTGKNSLEWVKNENDRGLIERMLQMNEKEIIAHAVKNYSSCSPGAAASVVSAVKTTVKLPSSHFIDYYTSADIMPDSSFVGYTGIVYS